MAVCSTTAHATSRLPATPLFFDSAARLAASRSSWCAPLTHATAALPSRRFSATSFSRITPLVQAKQQTFSSFDDLLEKSEKPVLVDFYATWCGPCKFMVPILEEVGNKLKDKIQVVKIDTEKYPNIANRYNIEALPTFIIFKDGKPLTRFEGALPANQLVEQIESTLKEAKNKA